MSASVHIRVARLITVLALLGASFLMAAGTGWAGGPTSALLVAPGSERAAALYHSDPEYQQLETLLAEPASSTAPIALPTDGTGYITVTWLIHDVSIWRIDRIYPAKNGEHVIVTQLMDGTGGDADGMYPGQSGGATAVTHRSTNPAALQALLDKLGLAGVIAAADVALQAVSTPTVSTPTVSNPTVSNPTMVTASVAEPTGPAAVAGWMLAGLVLGAGTTALTIRYLPALGRRLVRESGPAGDEPVQMTRLPV